MTSESTVTVSQAQANLPKLLKQDSFAISRHGKVVGIFLSADRIEALMETMELMGNPEFIKALKAHESGTGKETDLDDVAAELLA